MSERYTRTAAWLHWTIAALIIANIIIGLSDGATGSMWLHKSIGLTVLLLSLARLAWRPLSGWLMVSNAPKLRPLSWFGLVDVPYLRVSPAAYGPAKETHELIAIAFAVLIVGHIVAALYHGLVQKDGLLARINPLPTRNWIAAAVAAVAPGRYPAAPSHRIARIRARARCLRYRCAISVRPVPVWRRGQCDRRIKGSALVGAHGRVRIARRVALFANVSNLFDPHAATFGASSDTGSVVLEEAPNATDPRAVSPLTPRRILAGINLRIRNARRDCRLCRLPTTRTQS